MTEILKIDSPKCVNCKLVIDDNKFFRIDDDKWHMNCFECYNCRDKLNIDSDFLRIGNDQKLLICSKCSNYQCASCNDHITNMAIILTNNEAYCKKCFKCFKCEKEIEGLKYAKTKKGLLCMGCHEVILNRKSAIEQQKKKDKLYLQEHNRSRSLDTYQSNLVIPKRSTRRTVVSPNRNAQSNRNSKLISTEEINKINSKGELLKDISTSNHSEDIDKFPDFLVSNDRKISSHIKSNSESVIPQFLPGENSNSKPNQDTNQKVHDRKTSIDEILNSTLENFDFDEESKIRKASLKAPNVEIRKNSTSSTDAKNLTMDDKNIMVSPKRHGIIVSNQMKADVNSEHLNYLSADKQETTNSIFYGKFRTPVGSIDLTNNAINSPISVNASDFKGGLTTDLRLNSTQEHDDKVEKVNGLAINFQTTDKENIDATSNPHLIDPQLNTSDSGQSSNDLSLPVITNTNTTNSNQNSLSDNGGKKKLSRSLSKISRNLVSNFKPKQTGNFKPAQPNNDSPYVTKIDDSLDTHSGWGVFSQKNNTSNIDNITSSKATKETRHSSRGKSDSTIYSDQKARTIDNTAMGSTFSHADEDAKYTHLRSNSNLANKSLNTPESAAELSSVTPSMDTNSTFTRFNATPSTSSHHYRKSSLQGVDNILKEDVAALSLSVPQSMATYSLDPKEVSSPTAAMLSKELAELDLSLRKMKLELRNMETSKSRLSNEIDNLRKLKDSLIGEVEQLKSERNSLASLYPTKTEQSIKEEETDELYTGLTPKKQTNSVNELTNIHSSNSKSKFWKLFSSDSPSVYGSPQQQSNTKLSPQPPNKKLFGNNPKNLGNSSEHPKLDISEPINLKSNVFEYPTDKSRSLGKPSFSGYNLNNSLSGENLYGSLLVKRCIYEGAMVPMLITTCISYIEKNENNLKTEGIYRKSGSQKLIEEIENEFKPIKSTQEMSETLKSLLDSDVNAVSNVLKRYLRKLPNPLIPFEVYEPLIEITKNSDLITALPNNEEQKNSKTIELFNFTLSSFKKLLNTIPVEHYVLLRILSNHVNKIAQFSQWNLMNLSNLAIVFSPSIIHDITGEKDMIDMKFRNYVTQFIFKNYEELFL
ncbi:hypothetical protein TPHA_0E01620 [Tetrapisispora phaffii CBS 4417]|uniref:Rho-GAP domain-containing protein n=1 Tax=Tetrapisispora phaffii (strain ATCC 24235 / CBS 4417 / NBRC 1672 / NRRL Y-8282 / UCD 70-5) TaxID=1071381 RepID=G8BTM7_TETPH|nr:hypothetical protein TPHA_0E01620 [Tetrapisispora phaffii CBS 4417]CCE63255.1 hypothetical protein TPHA_0E01620 [Tetrapisispora phaffii CBS 4417]